MNIAFFGGIYPNFLEREVLNYSKGKLDYAANNLQWSIIKGLDIWNKNPVTLINLMLIGSYPGKYSKIFIKKKHFSHIKGALDINVGFINLPGINLISRAINGIISSVNWARTIKNDKVIIIYSIHTPYLLAAIFAKLFYSSVKIFLIVPDLPEYMSASKNPIYRLFKALDKFIINICLLKMDGFVLLSDYMRERLNIRGKPWVCVEGIFDNAKINNAIPKNKKKIILYTGILSARYGLLNLLEAFNKIKSNDYELWLCGSGDIKDRIIQLAKQDPRIKYFGLVARQQVLKMQQEATVLVNPRTSEGVYTKYSFPSKIMEYLASGTPTIMHKLPAIPEEYFQYCFIAEKEDSEGLYNAIVSVCEKDQKILLDFGEKAQKFIYTEKNPKKQVEKIYRLINDSI